MPVVNYVFKVSNKNSGRKYEISLKLTINTPEGRRRRSDVFIVNYKHSSRRVVVFLL